MNHFRYKVVSDVVAEAAAVVVVVH